MYRAAGRSARAVGRAATAFSVSDDGFVQAGSYSAPEFATARLTAPDSATARQTQWWAINED